MADPSIPVAEYEASGSESEEEEVQPPLTIPTSHPADASEPNVPVAEREVSGSESESLSETPAEEDQAVQPLVLDSEAVIPVANRDVSGSESSSDESEAEFGEEPTYPLIAVEDVQRSGLRGIRPHSGGLDPAHAEPVHESPSALEASSGSNGSDESRGSSPTPAHRRRSTRYGGSIRLQYKGPRRKITDDDMEMATDPFRLHRKAHYRGSVTLRLPETPKFVFMSREEEPQIRGQFGDRAQKAVKAIANDILQEVQKTDEEEEEKSCAQCCQCLKRSEKESSATLTPQLKRASSQGFKMLKKILFPALPKFLRDLWVGTELVITIVAFVLAVVSFPDSLEATKVISTIALILSTLSIILALIDGYIYFFQLGSLAECIRTVRGKLKERRQRHNSAILGEENGGHEEPQNGLEEDEPPKKWWQLSPEWKEKFDTWFELVRNLTSEAILYPLLVCDLFDVIAGGTFAEGESVDLGFFVAGSFYLIVAVYFMRLVMVIGNLISLRRVPMIRNSSGSAKDQQALMGKFCVHILAQIFVHLMAIMAVATKISDENVNGVATNETDSIRASPFLIVNVALGGIVPISGVLIFFLANYFWMKEFSVSFWIDMISLLQAPSFADTVFDHDTEYKDKTLELIEKTEFGDVKDHFSTFKSTAYHTKFLYPLRIPILVVLGLLYEISLIVFMASLVYSTDSISGEVKFVLFGETRGLTAVFFILGVLLVIANIHILILVNLWLAFMLIYLVAASITVIVVTPFVILVYLPLGCCVSYLLCIWNMAKTISIFEETGIIVEDMELD